MSTGSGGDTRPQAVPHCFVREFPDRQAHADLLAWAIANEARFKPTTVKPTSEPDVTERTDPTRRISVAVREFGASKAALHRAMIEQAPGLVRELRVTPFEPSDVEIELVASNDGAFFGSHVDTFLGAARNGPDRLISAVYYFHAEPRQFSGGEFRLYPLIPTAKGTGHVDIQPEQNMLVAFPSWLPHEVRPVSCPSRQFGHSRFSVNLWLRRS